MKQLILIILILSVFGGLSADVLKGNHEEGVLRFEYRIVNKSDQVQDVKYYLSLPQSNERQEVFYVFPEPGYQKIITDKYNNQIVCYLEKAMQPQEVRTHGWLAYVKMYAANFVPGKIESVLSKKRSKLYLKDKENYLLTDPIIAKIKDQVIKDSDSSYQKAVSVFKYLINNVRYYRDDVWDPAPNVLKKGEGSCSEYNYAFISLLRASGVPARYTGGFVLKTTNQTRYDKTTYEDAVFHRWTEVFTKDYNWLPFDASRGSGTIKRFTNYFNYIGNIPSGIVQTYRGDGGRDNYLHWDYVATARSGVPKSLRDIPVFFYISTKGKKASLKSDIKYVKTLLSDGFTYDRLLSVLKDPIKREILFMFKNSIKRESYPVLIKGLLAVNHPSAIYYSLYCDHLKIKLPYFLHYSFLVDNFLKKEIVKVLKKEEWQWDRFEYWFRKARKEISYDKGQREFVLHNKKINLF